MTQKYFEYLLLFLLFIVFHTTQAFLQSYSIIRQTSLHAITSNEAASLRVAENADFDKIASLLSSNMYETEIPMMQKRELTRLAKADLDERYSERLGRRTLPSVLLVCEEGKDIIGAIGIDCRVLETRYSKFRKPKPTDDLSKLTIVPYVANLVIRKDKRRLGLAKKLLKASESFAEEWGFDSMYLMVDSRNLSAQKLYIRQDYKEQFTDENASCVVPSTTGLKTEESKNICFKKQLKSATKQEEPKTSLMGFFGSIFGKGK